MKRNVLESSKEIVSSMQSYRNLESIRNAKVKEYENLRKVMEEIDYLLAKLKLKMPRGVRKSHGSVKDDLSPGVRKLDKELDELEDRFSKTG